jgi:multicomponent Na+:H+ antiporter subunit B
VDVTGGSSILLRRVGQGLLAPTLVVAVAVLVKGYVQVGDGFAAGVIAAIGVVLAGISGHRDDLERQSIVRASGWITLAGASLATLVAFGPAAIGRNVFQHVPDAGAEVTEIGTLELITAVAFDVGVFLLVLGSITGIIRFVARRAPDEERPT